ncbi:MAG: type II toxin-antitoxin system VapC family toxin [Anaerolineae bacterium]|nr:type II toxin-antitoxin system VapC family toxin [Anaerolineae bacterium]
MADSVVIDASFAFRLLLPGPRQASCRELMERWRGEGSSLSAPSLWIYEVTSALCKAVHFDQLTRDEGRRALALAHSLEVRLVVPDAGLTGSAYGWTLRLGRASAYDSFYVALAERAGAALWSADHRLVDALVNHGVTWAYWIGGDAP